MYKLLIFCFLFCFESSCKNDRTEVLTQNINEVYNTQNFINDKYMVVFNTWSKLSYRDKIIFFDNEPYLGYFIRDVALYYSLTKDYNAKIVVEESFQFICDNYKVKGRLLSKASNGCWNRDFFARDCRLFYEAYTYVKSKLILNEIENQVGMWISLVKRNFHSGFYIFPYGLDSNDDLYSYEIDPNQNLIIAWLFSELYFCQESIFYKNKILKDVAYNETNAALSLQKGNGELMLAEHLPAVYDSNYGGYCSSILYNICQFFPEPKWIYSLKMMGRWLYNDFPMNHPWNTKDDYPNYVVDRFYPSNLLDRIPSFYVSGVSKEYVYEWIEMVKNRFPLSKLYLELKYFSSKTIPRSYFINGFNDSLLFSVDDPLVILDNKNLRIIWRNVERVRINGKDISILSESNCQLNSGVNFIDVFYSKTNFVRKKLNAECCECSIVIVDYNRKF